MENDSQRSIRDVLNEEDEASVFVNRDLVEPDTIIDEERIVGRDEQLESAVSYDAIEPYLAAPTEHNIIESMRTALQ